MQCLMKLILKVYEAKKRPLGMPVSIAVADFDMLAAVARVEPRMHGFIETFLPGPVTLILPSRRIIPGNPHRRDGYDWYQDAGT